MSIYLRKYNPFSEFRITLLRLFFILVSVAFLNCYQSKETPLRVATIPWPGYETIHLAQSLQYISSNQLRLVEQANQTQTFQSLRSGTVDSAMTTLDMALTLIDEKLDIKVVLVMDISAGADAVMVRPEITSLKALKGKRVGVETVAVGAVMLDAVLSAANLSVTDIQLVSVSANEHLSAYRENKVDAIVSFEPNRSKLLELGAKIIFDSNRIPGRIVDVLVIRKDMLDDPIKVKNLQTLIDVHFKALDYLVRNPEESANLLAPFLGVNPDQVSKQFTGISLPNLNENLSLLAGTSPSLLKSSKELADLMLRHHLLQSEINLDYLIEPRFLTTSQK